MTKTVPAAEFKENADALIDDVIERGDEVLLTKDGKAVAKVVPLVPVTTREARARYLESMRGTAIIRGDLLEPFDDLQWETE